MSLCPGDLVALCDPDDALPIFWLHMGHAHGEVKGHELAFVVCVSSPWGSEGLTYPCLLLANMSMGWVLDPHLLKRL